MASKTMCAHPWSPRPHCSSKFHLVLCIFSKVEKQVCAYLNYTLHVGGNIQKTGNAVQSHKINITANIFCWILLCARHYLQFFIFNILLQCKNYYDSYFFLFYLFILFIILLLFNYSCPTFSPNSHFIDQEKKGTKNLEVHCKTTSKMEDLGFKREVRGGTKEVSPLFISLSPAKAFPLPTCPIMPTVKPCP